MTTTPAPAAADTTDIGQDLAAHIIAGVPFDMPDGLTPLQRNLVYAYAVGWVTEVNRHNSVRRASR